jgi:hypothetical protein
VRVVGYKGKVLDGDSYQAELHGQSADEKTVILAAESPRDQALDLSQQFEEFKAKARTSIPVPAIPLDGCLPNAVVARFEVTRPATDIASLGLQDFDTILLPPQTGSGWTLEVAPTVSSVISSTVLRDLVSIAISVSCAQAQTAAPTVTATPTPAPAPTPTPSQAPAVWVTPTSD